MSGQSQIAYKILTAEQWSEWQKSGTFKGASIDLTDGYIHLSTAQQAGETYAKFFAGQNDLVVAAVDLEPLGDAVKWEPSRNDELFPHVYGTIPLTAVFHSWEKADAQTFEKLAKDEV